MMTKKRISALLLAALFLFVMLWSSAYIAAEAGHDCTGENCPVCYQINICRSTIKTLSLFVAAAAFFAAFIYMPCRFIFACMGVMQSYTLVSLKVKLSD